MNIALCFSGHVRKFTKSYPIFKNDFLVPTSQKHKIDIFIHTWSVLSPNSSFASNNFKYLNNKPFKPKILLKLFNPKKCVIENYELIKNKFLFSNFTNKEINYSISTEGIVWCTPMFYKIWACNELKKESERLSGKKYDFVIRCRFDWIPCKPFDFEHLSKEHLYIRYFGQYETGVADDTFALGSSEIMDKYSDLFINFSKILESDIEIGPERILGKYLQMKNIPCKCAAEDVIKVFR